MNITSKAIQGLAAQLETLTTAPILLHYIRAMSILGQHSSPWVRKIVWKTLDHHKAIKENK